MAGNTVARPDNALWTTTRAARELGLKRPELELALGLGRVRSVPYPSGPGRRITRAEIDRLRSENGFPEALRESVRAVAAPTGATLMDVPAVRLSRLARLGLLVPVSFYFSRYGALVWLYLAEELRQFAADEKNAPYLKGRLPEGLRGQERTGLDLRARNWRGRHLGFLLRQVGDDAWAQTAALASFLDPALVSDLVQDPYEQAHLSRLRPLPPVRVSASRTADLVTRITTASDPDEIDWLRTDLAQALIEARAQHPAPRPEPRTPQLHHPPHPAEATHPTQVARPARPTRPAQAAQAAPAPDGTPPHRSPVSEPDCNRPAVPTPRGGSRESRGLLGWLRRRS
ncbi:DUF6397 family protein [Streptomyces sp. NPDC088789]|uniref:DUF6397 family protein n=1 Tax=Streptomyces sp. NPDC088789 TaxID=3365899 RepID=UPI003816CD5B